MLSCMLKLNYFQVIIAIVTCLPQFCGGGGGGTTSSSSSSRQVNKTTKQVIWKIV